MASFTLTANGATLNVSDEDNCETIQDAFDLFRDVANLPAGATALVNGEPADFDSVVPDGAEVALNKPTGQKG